MTTEAGWYPDPEDPSKARYWDGSGWTDEVRELEADMAEAAPVAPREELAEPAASPPPDAPPDDTGGGAWWRRPWIWGAALAIVAAAVVAAVFLTRDDSSSAEVILEPTASKGADPFTESVARQDVAVDGGGVEKVAGKDRAVESVSGDTPELYGGSGEEAVCDPKQLVAFLEENPDKAKAFAGALGIKPGGIARYVAGLTPVVLREDTRVTNHGFENGVATPFQAVLQAGTAVLVDDRGVPRVRCACGNPLGEPTAVSSSPDFTGEGWAGFDEDRLVAVSPSGQPVDSLKLVDVNTGQVYAQPVGAAADCSIQQLGTDAGPLAIDVSSANVDCAEAKRVFERYYNDPSIPHEGSGGAATVDGWFCISYSPGDRARGDQRATTCSRGNEEISTLYTSRNVSSSASNGCPPGMVPFEGACVDESRVPGATSSGSGSSAGTSGGGASGSTASSDWPTGESAWSVFLASKRSRATAAATAERARSAGLTDVGLLRSSEHSSLNPGYWVAYTGVLTKSEAKAREREARAAGFADAYARYVSAG